MELVALVIAGLAIAAAVFFFNRVNALTAAVTAATAERDELKKRVDAEQKEAKKASDRAAGTQRDIAELKARLAQEKDKAKAKAAVTPLNATRADKLQEEFDRLSAKFESVSEKLAAANEAVTSFEKTSYDRKVEVDAAKAEVARLRETLAAERAAASKELAELRAHVPTDPNLSPAQIKAPLEAELAAIKAQIAQQNDKLDKAGRDKRELEEKLKKLAVRTEQYRRISMIAKLDAERYQDANTELNAQLIDLRRKKSAGVRDGGKAHVTASEVVVESAEDLEHETSHHEELVVEELSSGTAGSPADTTSA
jgi:predicted  nucleic acid-binding Zn-ribbon protein